MKPKILVVEDDPDVQELIEFTLSAAGYKIISAQDGAQGLEKARRDRPQAIVLDLMIPQLDGLELCKIIRRDPDIGAVPILILTAKAGEVDRILGFELGADDYVTKPFSPRELVLRVKAVLRRGLPPEAGDLLRAGDLVVDAARHSVALRGKKITLTFTEFKLLAALMQRKGRVLTRENLLRDVWEYEADVDTRTVDTHVRRLREKLGAAAAFLETVRGLGYRFSEEL